MTYCGKKYGFQYTLAGIAAGAASGAAVGMIMFQETAAVVILGAVMAFLMRKQVKLLLIGRRKKELQAQFCDYLDSLSSSFAVGRNSHSAFINAASDMEDLYRTGSPIVFESRMIADGLENGEPIDRLLRRMAEDTECAEAASFSEVFSICSITGGNLKKVVDNTRNILSEKIALETEISTILTGPKNELNIMIIMPFVIVASLRWLESDWLSYGDSSAAVNAAALAIFIGSYLFGRRITNITV